MVLRLYSFINKNLIVKYHIEQTILYMITCPIEFVTPSSSDTRNNKSVFDFENGIILDLSSL